MVWGLRVPIWACMFTSWTIVYGCSVCIMDYMTASVDQLLYGPIRAQQKAASWQLLPQAWNGM